MNLSMLTASGWVWLWLTMTVVFTLSAKRSRERGHEMVAALMVAWLLWLVTP